MMKKPTRPQYKTHFSPVRRVEREGRWHPGWCEVDGRGQPLYPHYTKAEAEHYARQRGTEPVFHDDFDAARAAALVLPGE